MFLFFINFHTHLYNADMFFITMSTIEFCYYCTAMVNEVYNVVYIKDINYFE